MQIFKTPAPPAPARSALKTLKMLGRRHRKKLLLTFFLVVAENVMYLLYPLLAGFAINAMLSGRALHAMLYAGMVFIMWAIGAARRSVGTGDPDAAQRKSGRIDYCGARHAVARIRRFFREASAGAYHFRRVDYGSRCDAADY